MDRNNAMQIVIVIVNASLSARRAWIEISVRSHPGKPNAVALRKESVDRNKKNRPSVGGSAVVALRKESGDRNGKTTSVSNGLKRRSPQGERG